MLVVSPSRLPAAHQLKISIRTQCTHLFPLVQPDDHKDEGENSAYYRRADPWDPIAGMEEELGAPFFGVCYHRNLRFAAIAFLTGICRPS